MRKRDAEESLLLNKASSVMASVPAVSAVKEEDDDHVFGRFIASELRSIDNMDLKRLVKWIIQSTIYFATSSQSVVPQLTQPQPTGSVINLPSYPSPSLSSIGNQSSGPVSPTGSYVSSNNSSFTHDILMH